MRTPREIYAQYKIMPNLQLHQLRVAAVAKIICNNFNQFVNEREVILACLFHDMGNMIKSNFSAFPEFVEPEGMKYWERVKEEFIQKYGRESHAGNVAIAREIGLPERVIGFIDGVGYSKMQAILTGPSFEQKICEYADTRVGPHGVLPQVERISEGKQRYDARMMDAPRVHYQGTDFENLLRAAHQLEQQIFALATIRPEDMTDASIAPLIEELKNYRVD